MHTVLPASTYVCVGVQFSLYDAISCCTVSSVYLIPLPSLVLIPAATRILFTWGLVIC